MFAVGDAVRGFFLVFGLVFGVVALSLVHPSPAGAASKTFPQFLKQVRAEAMSKGISRQTAEAALPDSLRPIPRVLELDKKQPEKTRTFDQYLQSIVSQVRVDQGRSNFSRNSSVLNSVAETYGVEPQVIVALWGIETNYGKNTGGFEIIPALATLAWDGRREAFFKDELFKALKIVDEGHIHIHDMKGSWAGAMGQSQFMPSSFLRFAQDYNNDGRRDIWNTTSDVFASAANYLSQSGWKKGQPWGREVKLPQGFDRKLIGLEQHRSLQFWHDLGIRSASGKGVPFEGAYYASIVQPGGEGTAAYMVYDNYKVIMKWNKSTYFATAVGLLSDRVHNGKPDTLIR